MLLLSPNWWKLPRLLCKREYKKAVAIATAFFEYKAIFVLPPFQGGTNSCREVSTMFQKESIQAAFDRYVDQFDRATPGIASKQLHSHIVSRLCEKLAAKLGWSEHDVQLAWVMGLLHDIGRFEQARRYHTFIDYKSMDHARYG
jgi:putative nucleotidyltransferase with HDIG domain